MILITSASYINPGLQAEFGLLPPCMLPLQNRRLYRHQLELFKGIDDDVVLSLPEGYELTTSDAATLNAAGVETVHVPGGRTLGESVVYVLNKLARYSEPLRLLHGDTLLGSLPEGLDVFAVAAPEDDYGWAYFNTDELTVYAGYFAFADPSRLISAITECGYSFMDGVKLYASRTGMRSVAVDGWMDFGITTTYFRSRARLTTQRVFNDLTITHHSVRKCSLDKTKMAGEAQWFRNVPRSMRHFCPAVWDQGETPDGRGFYELEYLYLTTLADLYVYGANPFFVWKQILDNCAALVDAGAAVKPSDIDAMASENLGLFGPKTSERLKRHCREAGIDMQREWRVNGQRVPSLNRVLADVTALTAEPRTGTVGVMHGDLCFSNILYDFKSRSVKVLDPRGVDANGQPTIFGDIRYDVGKLGHSILGMYDYIIGGIYTLTGAENELQLDLPASKVVDEVRAYFLSQRFGGFTPGQLDVYPIMVHLFLSMLPLHSDRPDRQRALLANALRLYNEIS